MDWGFIFNSSVSATIGLEAVVFCLAAIGINIQFVIPCQLCQYGARLGQRRQSTGLR